jgi:acetyltransferase
LSPDIVHKSEVGGVRLNLTNAHSVVEAVEDILTKVRTARPDARIRGVTVHPMIVKPKAQELIVGIADDPTFGPIVAFGCGGIAVEAIDDKALALPPLDLKLARELISRTRISKLLAGYRNVPAADVAGIALVLVKVAQLAADFPEIRELDINPLLADQAGVIAVDARISVAPLERLATTHPRFAIRPYPKQWERRTTTPDGAHLLLRPIRPEDEELMRRFFSRVTPDDLRLRFFAPVKDIGHAFIARLTQLDYARAMAFIAIDESSGEMLGGVRLHADANYQTAEYAILVRSDLKGHGIGWLLMQLMIEYARTEGLRRIEGQVLRENTTMLTMCAELGFRSAPDADDAGIVDVSLDLR